MCNGKGKGETKKQRGNKDFKKVRKLGQRMGALKRGGWNPLSNYACITLRIKYMKVNR